MDRRNFLKFTTISCATLSLRSMFAIPEAFAQSLLQENVAGAFVLIVVKEGMDVTLGLDPWIKLPTGIDDKDIFIEYSPSQVMAPLGASGPLLGPAAMSLAPFMKDMAIINGIFQNENDNGHDANRQYIMTGNGMGLAPDAPVALYSHFGDAPLGLLVLDSSPYFAKEKVSITSLRDVKNWNAGGDPTSILKVLLKAKASRNTDFLRSQQSTIELAPFRQPIQNRLQNLEKIGQSLPTSNEDELKTLMACIGSGVGRVAELVVRPENESLDTHSDHVKIHLAGQTSVWNQISEIFKIAKATQFKNTQSSVFDNTTFMVVSDFSRTPFLNSNNGKDHNPNTNSVLLAGRGIKGGQVIGKSLITSRKKSPTFQAIHMGAPIDYRTGRVIESVEKAGDSNIDFIYPEVIMATVFKSTGVSDNFATSIGSETPILKNVIKD